MILCITWNVSDNSMTKEDNDKRLEPWWIMVLWQMLVQWFAKQMK
jgi:hypothetical protein